MSENRNDDFELDFLDDEENTIEIIDDEEYEEAEFEEVDEDEEFEEAEFEEVDEESENDYDKDSDEGDELDRRREKRGKLSKETIVNRIMIGMGIAIAGFTIFYGVKVYGVINAEPPTESQVIQENATTLNETEVTTEELVSDTVFTSPYKDTNISEEVKELLNDISLDSSDTGLSKLDLRVANVIAKATNEDKTVYENVRNIYDYMIYNFDLTSKSYVDDDTIYETCSSVDYISSYDMELIYRANKVLNSKAGSAEDFACAFTVLLRNYGIEAFYIEGEAISDGEYDERGYTIIIIDDEYYLFDVAHEKDSISDESNMELGYFTFCKTFDEVSDIYTEEGIEESLNKFENFETLAGLSFSAKFTTDNEGYASGSVKYVKGYSSSGNSTEASGNIVIELGEKVYLSGSVSGSNKNTWKLVVKVYDKDMNYLTESTLYDVTLNGTTNQVTYTPARAGFMKLSYMVTDSNGRTCTISTTVEVKGDEPETTTENESTDESENIDKNTESEESDSQEPPTPRPTPRPTEQIKPVKPIKPSEAESSSKNDETTEKNSETESSGATESSGETSETDSKADEEETTSKM